MSRKHHEDDTPPEDEMAPEENTLPADSEPAHDVAAPAPEPEHDAPGIPEHEAHVDPSVIAAAQPIIDWGNENGRENQTVDQLRDFAPTVLVEAYDKALAEHPTMAKEPPAETTTSEQAPHEDTPAPNDEI